MRRLEMRQPCYPVPSIPDFRPLIRNTGVYQYENNVVEGLRTFGLVLRVLLRDFVKRLTLLVIPVKLNSRKPEMYEPVSSGGLLLLLNVSRRGCAVR